MLQAFRYIARNPVVAGLCNAPADWIWGSYRDCIQLDNRFPFVSHEPVRSYFGPDRVRATRLLRDFVEDVERGSVPGRAA